VKVINAVKMVFIDSILYAIQSYKQLKSIQKNEPTCSKTSASPLKEHTYFSHFDNIYWFFTCCIIQSNGVC